MEPKFQSSFIPKGPIVSASPKVSRTPAPSAHTSISLLPSVGTILFVLALLAWGGLWGYGHYLQSGIVTSEQSLADAQSAFDPQTTSTLLTASNRIHVAQTLVQKHVAISNLFNLLEQSILPSVTFDSLTFNSEPDGSINLVINGTAASYAALAEQSRILNGLPYLSAQTFDNLVLTDKGNVTWDFSAALAPSTVSYVAAQSSGQVQTVVPITAPVSAVSTTSVIATSTKQ